MIVLAILQNQWFRDPERVRQMIADGERKFPGKYRRRLIATSLFAGCRTGANLRKTFGPWCDEIIWEEASPEIGGQAASCFAPDAAHLAGLLKEIKPDVVIAFGNIAYCAIYPLVKFAPHETDRLIRAPHPTARAGDTMRRLHEARRQLDVLSDQLNQPQ